MWQVKYFKTFDKMQAWEKAHKSEYQIIQIFINNGIALECKKKIFVC